MRIDGHLPAHDAQATDATRRTTTDAPVRKEGAASVHAASSDRIELSGDAALLTSALRAANETPDVRADAVDRARRKLESGGVGTDPLALADAILNDLLK